MLLCNFFFFFPHFPAVYSISVQRLSEFIQSWRSHGRALLLSKEETNMALNSRGIPQKKEKRRGSASLKQEPIVIWVTQEGWRTGRRFEATGGWRSGTGRWWRWVTPCAGYSGLRYGASTAAPRSPSTSACSLWTPSEGTPAALLVLSTAACNVQTPEAS